MRTVATFQSDAFNVSEPKEYFINPGCFGDDVARWLIKRLVDSGVRADDEPGQEDFGWYFDFETPEGEHTCVLAYRPGEAPDDGDWILWVERSAGFIGSLLGRRNRVSEVAVRRLHQALSEASEVHRLRWHDKRLLDRGS